MQDCLLSYQFGDSKICSPEGDSLSAVIGDTVLGTVLTMASTLPSIIVHMRLGTCSAEIEALVKVSSGWQGNRPGHVLVGTPACAKVLILSNRTLSPQSLALASDAHGWRDLAYAYMAIAEAISEQETDVSWIGDFMDVFSTYSMPVYGRWVLQRFVEAVERGSGDYLAAGLLTLQSLFQVCWFVLVSPMALQCWVPSSPSFIFHLLGSPQVEGLDLSHTFDEMDQDRFCQVLSPFVSTDVGPWVLQVMKAAFYQAGSPVNPCGVLAARSRYGCRLQLACWVTLTTPLFSPHPHAVQRR